MPFEVGDEVVYNGSLGTHHGTVVAVSQDGAVEVSVPALPERLRTDTDSLSARYAKGGVVPAGTTTVTNTAGSDEPEV